MDKELIAKKLLELRGNRTRDVVAEHIGISISALQMYENGQRVPKDEIKVKLAKFYGVSVQELFFERRTHVLCS